MTDGVQWIGLRELQAAVKRNPQMVLKETRRFLTRGIAEYKRGIIRNPWMVGGSRGGAPVDTGNLRDTHFTVINKLEASIGPDPAVKYARFVHEGTRYQEARPWLEYVKKSKAPQIETHYRTLLTNITRDLAR